MTDITGIGKILPIEKLIEVLSSAVGRISKSYYDRKDSDSKVYEIKKIAEAKAYEFKVMEITKKELNDDSLDLLERAENRKVFKELNKQENIENIANAAAEQLRTEDEVSQEPLDEDWKTRFFNYAEDVSTEEMQNLWGRILAGEIKRPKTFSLRTLEFIRNLSKEEANVLNKVGALALYSSGKYFIIEKILSETFEITLDEILTLKELGIINPNELSLELKTEKNSILILTSGEIGLYIKRIENGNKKMISGNVFTKLGTELLGLINRNYKPESFIEIKNIMNDNKSVEFKVGNVIIQNNQIYLQNLKDLQ